MNFRELLNEAKPGEKVQALYNAYKFNLDQGKEKEAQKSLEDARKTFEKIKGNMSPAFVKQWETKLFDNIDEVADAIEDEIEDLEDEENEGCEDELDEAQSKINVLIYRKGKIVAEQPIPSEKDLKIFLEKHFKDIGKADSTGAQKATALINNEEYELVIVKNTPLWESIVSEAKKDGSYVGSGSKFS